MSDLKKKKKLLVFVTSEFPYGKTEIFLEREIPFLAKAFDKLMVFSGSENDGPMREIPEGTELHRIPYQDYNLKSYFTNLKFWKLVWLELFSLVFTYGKLTSWGRIKTILNSSANALRIKDRYTQLLQPYMDQYEVFLYNFWYNDSTIAMSLMKEENPRFTMVTRMHRWDLYFEENDYNHLPFRRTRSQYLDAVYSASQGGVDYARERWKVKNPNILKLCRLGIKVNPCQEVDLNKRIIVSCSNVIPVKRVDLIAKVVALLKTENVQWFHFGEGVEWENVKEETAKLLSDKNNFHFMGHATNKNLHDWYREFEPSLFINLSRSEGIPVSIMEAMSFGIPCLATAVGGTPELVNNKNGFSVSVDTPKDEIANLIDQFFNLEEQDQRNYKKAAHDTVNRYYNASINYPNFGSEIQELAEKSESI